LWQAVEVRLDGAPDPLDQYVWDVRYVDAPVVRFHDGNTDGDLDGGSEEGDNTLYYTTDANWNVTALVDAETGEVVERYMYDPYGKATVCEEDWTPREDNASAVANDVLYCGYRFDAETGLYHVRYRYYHPTLGRWTGRDAVGYADGTDLYQYAGCAPTQRLDPFGLASEQLTQSKVCQFVRDQPISDPPRLEAIIPWPQSFRGDNTGVGLARAMGIWSRQAATLWKCCNEDNCCLYLWGAPDQQVAFTYGSATKTFPAHVTKVPLVIPVPGGAVDIGPLIGLKFPPVWIEHVLLNLPGPGDVGGFAPTAGWQDADKNRNLPPGYAEVQEAKCRDSCANKPVPQPPQALPDTRPKRPVVPVWK
jgi:RHS repeat-associated protein